MKKIDNIKDPPTCGRCSRSISSLCVAAIVALALAVPQCFGARVHRDNGMSGAADSGMKTNVSCIAHDAKFSCDCQDIQQEMQLPRLVGYVFQVEISNCRSLTIEANTLEETQGLRKITFRNINNLALRKYALAFPRYASNTPLIIEFEQVNFEIIDSHAINGNIEEISFIGGQIDVIHPFGFTTLKERAILLKLDNVLVKKIEPQAFKKFAVEQLEITNCNFVTNVPSKAFYELEVLSALRIHNVRFQEVHSRAFSFKMISKLSITDNRFGAVDAEWLEAHVRESPLIRNNHFGLTSSIAFKGIGVHRDYVFSERLEFRFLNNTVRFSAEPRAFEFNDRFALSIKQLQYENEFVCRDLDMSHKPARPKVTFFQQFSDNVYFQRQSTSTTANTNNQSFVVLNKIIEVDCRQPSYLLYILLSVLVLIVILIIVSLLVWLRWAKKRKRRKMDVVMPEPRTYKETQIVYQIENAGLLKTDL